MILGANLYFDTRWTEAGNRMYQGGAGVEFLSEWVDARANYYLPEDDEYLVDRFTRDEERVFSSSSKIRQVSGSRDVVASGNSIAQQLRISEKVVTRTTKISTHYVFEQYESALEGFDAEIGGKIPYLSELAETKLFVGYQRFDNPYGEDFDGLKGRIEIRPMNGVYIDGEYFEDDDLNGTSYILGARVRLPFDVANLAAGKNPFEGAGDAFERDAGRSFQERLGDMVIRDVRVRSVASAPQEVVEARSSTSATSTKVRKVREVEENVVLLSDVQFVDKDNAGDPQMNGTAEHPWDEVNEGVANASGQRNVYVFDSEAGPYEETVELPDNTKLYGRGAAIEGLGGKVFPAGEYPILQGDGRAPTVTMGENTTLAGFIIRNSAPVSDVWVSSPNRHGDYNVAGAGIVAVNKSNLTIRDNIVEGATYGGVIVDTLTGADDSFRAAISRNIFRDNTEGGLFVDTRGGSGVYDVLIEDNEFTGNVGVGLGIDARSYDTARLEVNGGRFECNAEGGLRIEEVSSDAAAEILVNGVTANHNEGDGIHIERGAVVTGEGFASLTLSNIEASSNSGNGIYMRTGAKAGSGGAAVVIDSVVANNNQDTEGIYIVRGAVVTEGDAYLGMSNVVGNDNAWDGVWVITGAQALSGQATAWFTNISGSDNDEYSALWINTGAECFTGTAVTYVRDITAINNGDAGLYMGRGAAVSQGEAYLTVATVYAASNREDGVWIGTGAVAGTGQARVSLYDMTCNENGKNGIYVNTGASVTEGYAYLRMSNVVGNDNAWDGASIGTGAVAGTGQAQVYLYGLTCNENGNNGVYVNTGASVTDGYAYFGMSNVGANDNAWDGASIGTGAKCVTGTAFTYMNDITAINNGENGLYITRGAAVSQGGAFLDIWHVYAVSNTWDGVWIRTGAIAKTGEAEAQLYHATCNGNGSDGIFFNRGAAVSEGAAEMGIYYAQACSNGGEWGGNGIEINKGATAITGRAALVFSNITASSNTSNGISILTGAAVSAGDAYVYLSSIAAERNGYSGIGIYSYGAHAVTGNATMTLINIDANNNADYGIEITRAAATAAGNALLDIQNIGASGNRDGNGLYISDGARSTTGEARVNILNVVANDNRGYGIYIASGARSEDDSASVALIDVYAIGNRVWWGGGIWFHHEAAKSIWGDASLTLSNVNALSNGMNHGIQFSAGTPEYAVDSAFGVASLYFNEVTANNNDQYGIYFQHGMFRAGAVTDVVHWNVTTVGNGSGGVYEP